MGQGGRGEATKELVVEEDKDKRVPLEYTIPIIIATLTDMTFTRNT